MNSSQSLQQLESARSLALGDGRYYPTIIPGVLPIIGVNSDTPLEIRRWGADFLAETFASPTWSLEEKEQCSLSVLPTLKAYLDLGDDKGIVKSAVQAAASIYPLVYKHTISNPHDAQHWQHMAAIKSNILRKMDSAPPGVRICCVKFLQQVILVETPAIVDPRRPELTEISLALVPRDHALLQYSMLEAESSGLLDRLLDIIHGDHSDALLVTAALNCLGTLIQRRPYVANRVLHSVLGLNPLKLANSPMTPRNKVIMKSIERTYKMLLANYMKRHPESPFNGKIHQHLERIAHMHRDIFDETNRKRPAPAEPTDGLDPSKRQRLAATVPPAAMTAPPLPDGPVSFAQLFTLTPPGSSSSSFDVSVIPQDLVLKLLVPLLRSIEGSKLEQATHLVRERYQTLGKRESQARPAVTVVDQTAIDDEEEYEPELDTVEDAEQIVNKLDSAPPDTLLPERVPEAPLAPFKLPQAPPLTEQEVAKYSEGTVKRLFGMMTSLDPDLPNTAKAIKAGFNRLAGSHYDRDSWITIICRLATRSASGLEEPTRLIKSETRTEGKSISSTADRIRYGMLQYVTSDWKRGIDIAIAWLCEEWYNDRVQAEIWRNGVKKSPDLQKPPRHYPEWVLRLIDSISPYIEGTDHKVVIRFFSEIPEIDEQICKRIKQLANDPDRVQLTGMILAYLLMFRPPARHLLIETVAQLWRENDGARSKMEALLRKYKPDVLKEDEIKTNNGWREPDKQEV